jgi:cation:H+ antiporter
VALALVVFISGALISLATSWLLVTRLERIGERLGLSEALLGILAALAADAPEITSSISALSQHQRIIGTGVIIGSNVFNLAALLGLGALVAGSISLRRRAVILGGVVAIWIAVCCLATSTGVLPVLPSLVLALFVFAGYLTILALHGHVDVHMPFPKRLATWLATAVDEEELCLEDAIRPSRGRPADVFIAGVALIIVVLSSVAMERSASELGRHFHISDAIVGGLILAAVTSLPNAVAAVHLASKGRGAAALSTALSSNNLNVVVGLLIPGALIGLAAPSFAGNLTATSYLLLTVIVLVLAYMQRGLGRRSGALIVGGYLIFILLLLTTA